jgi:hypothetical protein
MGLVKVTGPSCFFLSRFELAASLRGDVPSASSASGTFRKVLVCPMSCLISYSPGPMAPVPVWTLMGIFWAIDVCKEPDCRPKPSFAL